MGFGVQVESQQLRTGAGKMRQFASEATQIPPDSDRDADSAANANQGFMTGDACKAIAKDLKDDMEELNAHLEDTADVLEEIAGEWDSADSDNAGIFDGIQSELGNFKLPGS